MSEKISKGVIKVREFEDSHHDELVYKAMCDCGSNDHDVTICVKYDKEFHSIDLEFYKMVQWNAYWKDTWYEKWWNRIKNSLTMLFTGYVEMEESFLIRDEEVIDNIITAFIEGRRRLSISHSKDISDQKNKKI